MAELNVFFRALRQAGRDPDGESNGVAADASPPPAGADRAPAATTVRAADRSSDVAMPDGIEAHLVSLLYPASFEAERYRELQHNVEHLHDTARLTVLAVSSPGSGDGKTTTAINLAGTLAQLPNARVLLVDADLRRPSIAGFLDLDTEQHPGLVDAVADPGLTLDAVVRPCPPFNLSVVAAGEPPVAPYELLKSPRLDALLAEARRRYDYVILDTAPLVDVADCRLIARCVDGFLVVVMAHKTPRRLLEEALTVIDTSKIVGIVFNRDDRRPARYGSGSWR